MVSGDWAKTPISVSEANVFVRGPGGLHRVFETWRMTCPWGCCLLCLKIQVILRGLKNVPGGDRLLEINLISLSKGRLESNLIVLFKYVHRERVRYKVIFNLVEEGMTGAGVCRQEPHRAGKPD